ncbi:MAG: penicillin-binding protein [Solirubrobacteraceae bacterium]|nr:penicillin-binding protein [Solirubrobacteraceae bacterium]
MFLGATGRPQRRGGRGRPPVGRLLAVLLVLAALVAGGVLAVRALSGPPDRRHAAAQAYVAAWSRRDIAAMWRALDPATRQQRPLAAFRGLVQRADAAAGVTQVRTGRLGPLRDGAVRVPVAVSTSRFGTLRGVMTIPVRQDGEVAGVRWTPDLRLPGLRAREAVTRRSGPQPRRASVLGADGHVLQDAVVGRVPSGSDAGSGLERQWDARLAGAPSATLRFGSRTIRRVAARPGRSVRTTLRPGLQATATAALGGKLGGVAVLRPSDGAILALGGLASSAPQPPGSTFKIVTVSAALKAGITSPGRSYPVRSFATLSGVKLRNASDESCGGTLSTAFAQSCNSVFAPLGAQLGAKRLVAAAEAFGFNEAPRVPGAKTSTIPSAAQLKDSLAVGASAIGQDRDLATPLQMASVGATIGRHGMRTRPRLVTLDPIVRRRVVSSRVAAQVRTMMLGVVSSGTGTAAALPGIQVAGKTGTAELRPTAGGPPDPKNTDAWFVAFAPAQRPTVAVAVMLVGAGAGGKAAAPIARQVLRATLVG